MRPVATESLATQGYKVIHLHQKREGKRLAITLSGDSVVVVSRDQVSCDLAGEEVILNLNSGMYYGLDGVGFRIWSLIQQPASIAKIRDSLMAEYEVEADQCERELIALIQKLAGHGLIEVKNGKGS